MWDDKGRHLTADGVQGRILKKQERLTMVVSVMEPKLLMKMLQVTLTGGPGGSRRPSVRQRFTDTAAGTDETTRGSEGSVFSERHICPFTMTSALLRKQNLTSRKLLSLPLVWSICPPVKL